MIEVNIGACQCPNTPHADGDVVRLRERLGLAAGIAVQKLIIEANTADNNIEGARRTGLMAEGLLLYGVESWNLVGLDGHPLPVSPETIRVQLLDDFERGQVASEKADDLYSLAVLSPLLKQVRTLSPPSPRDGSTSATGSSEKAKAASPSTRSSRKPPKRSKPSSITSTQTGAITVTSSSPVGVSNSWPKSA